MISCRTCLRGLALVTVILLLGVTSALAQTSIPRMISYQGQLLSGTTPMSGTVAITVNIYQVGGTTPLYTETFSNVTLQQNGVFNLLLGSQGLGFPTSLNFSQPYEIGLQINGAAEMTPRTPLTSSPYSMTALNALSIGGIPFSSTPSNGTFFPIPITNGFISTSILPPLYLNGLPPINGNFNIAAGPNITITKDTINNRLIIGSTAVSGAITGVFGTGGLMGGGTSGDITLSVAPGGITGSMIAMGTLTSANFAPGFFGSGLGFDQSGALSVLFNPSQFMLVNNQLTFNPGANFVGGAGSFTTLTSSGNSTIGTTAAATNNTFGTGGNAPFVMNTIGSTGVGSVTTINGTTHFTGTVDLGGQQIINIGAATGPNSLVTKAYVDSINALGNSLLGDITGSTGASFINVTNLGIGNRLIQALNLSTTGVLNNTLIPNNLIINGGIINGTPIGLMTPSSGEFTTLSSSGNSEIGNSSTALANTFGTGGNAPFVMNTIGSSGIGSFTTINGNLNVNGAVNFNGMQVFGVGTPFMNNSVVPRRYVDSLFNMAGVLTGDIFGAVGNNFLNVSNPGLGTRLITAINLGTGFLSQTIIPQNLTIFNGSINSTPIGMTTPSSGIFTTLTSLGATNLAVNSGYVGIGTSAPACFIDARDTSSVNVLQRLWNTGSGEATMRVVAGTGSHSNLELTDNAEYLASIAASHIHGLEFNVRNHTAPNTESAMNTSTILTISHTGDFLLTANSISMGGDRVQNVATPILASDAATKGYVDMMAGGPVMLSGDITGSTSASLINPLAPGIGLRLIQAINASVGLINGVNVNPNFGNQALYAAWGTFTNNSATQASLTLNNLNPTGPALNIVSGSVRSSGTGQYGGSGATTSYRFADRVTVSGGSQVTINNALVTVNSTIIVTFRHGGTSTPGHIYVSNVATGSFVVKTSSVWHSNDEIDYLIVNP